MAILLFVHLTRHSSTASEQLSCISPVPAPAAPSTMHALRPPAADAYRCAARAAAIVVMTIMLAFCSTSSRANAGKPCASLCRSLPGARPISSRACSPKNFQRCGVNRFSLRTREAPAPTSATNTSRSPIPTDTIPSACHSVADRSLRQT